MDNILVAVDFSDATAEVVVQAAKQARAFGAKLWLVHVAPPAPDFVGYEPGPQVVRDQLADELRTEHRQLQELAKFLENEGVEITPLLLHGATVQTIANEARKLAAELIVIGSHGHGNLYRALLGSVSQGIVREAPCPVLIVSARAKVK